MTESANVDDTAHPHDLVAEVPDRVAPSEIRRLSLLDDRRAVLAIALEWLGIAGAVVASVLAQAWPVTVLAVVFIGARQHALLVIAHDAAHFRLLRSRAWNDWIGNLLLAWPMFISVEGFRFFHGDHHRFLNGERDGNRVLWGTHDRDGQVAGEWSYPKTITGLVYTVLRRAVVWTGVFWMVRGLVGGFMFGSSFVAHAARVLFWGAIFVLLHHFQAWRGFLLYWVLPYVTWHVAVQYVRLICEHSAVRSDDPRYADTRSTMPGLLGRLFVLPRNIGYHLAHHWYPSVPFYRLPELHALLERTPSFAAHARCSRSILASLRDVTAR
jgi:fatty acid desaturase